MRAWRKAQRISGWAVSAALLGAPALAATACASDEAKPSPDPTTGCPEGSETGPDGRCEEVPGDACPAGTEPDGDGCSAPGCPPGSWVHEGECAAAGPRGTCPPGEQEHRGACVAAGVPPDTCPAGFVPDDGGCDPVLPDAPCPSGSMALPGDASCEPVGDCGRGTYGDIPVEVDTEFVDASFEGPSDGSQGAPWTTILQGLEAAEPGAIVAVAAGSYERFAWQSDEPVRIWGRCPAMVAITAERGVDGVFLAGVAGEPLPPSELRGITIVGPAFDGLRVDYVQDLRIEDVVIRGSHRSGLFLDHILGTSRIVAKRVLIEDVQQFGLVGFGGEIEIDGVHVKRTETSPGISVAMAASGEVPVLDARRVHIEEAACLGVFCASCEGSLAESTIHDMKPGFIEGIPCPGVGVGVGRAGEVDTTSRFAVDGVTIDRARGAGIVVDAGDAEIMHTSVRDTVADEQFAGHGIHVHPDLMVPWMDVRVMSSLVHGSVANGILASSATVSIEGTLIRDTRSYVAGPNAGRLGIGLQALEMFASIDSGVTLRGSRIERSAYAGLASLGATIDAAGLSIVETSDDVDGLGVGVFATTGKYSGGEPEELRLAHSEIERSVGVGMLLAGVRAEVEGVVVADTSLSLARFPSSSGIMIQPDADGVVSEADLHGVAVERSYDVGIAIFDSTARVSGSRIEAIRPNHQGRFGDGALAVSTYGSAFMSLEGVSIAASERAAVASFGATVEYGGSIFECQAFDLNGEQGPDSNFSFVDLGANACGCPSTNACQVVSAELDPPNAIVTRPPPPASSL